MFSKFLRLFLPLLLAITICGVSVQSAESASAVTLKIWTLGSSDTMNQIYQGYMTAHPGVTIVVEDHSVENLLASFEAAMLSHTEPDIIDWGNDVIGDLAIRGYILDLAMLGDTPALMDTTYDPVSVKATMWAHKYWALPEFREGIALVYNKAVIPDGSPYLPTDPMDFAALYTKAQQFKNTHPGKTLICNQGFSADDAYHVAPIFFGFGIPSYISEGGNVYVNRSDAVAAGNWIDAFHAVSQDIHNFAQCQYDLINGNVGMWWTGPWAINFLTDQGVNYGIAPMGKPFVGVRTFMITSAAENRGSAVVAWDLIQLATNYPNEKSLALYEGLIPSNTSAFNDSSVQALKSIKGFGQAFALGVPMGNSIFTNCQWAPVGTAVGNIWSGAFSATDALNIAKDEIELCVQPIFDEFYPLRLFIPATRK